MFSTQNCGFPRWVTWVLSKGGIATNECASKFRPGDHSNLSLLQEGRQKELQAILSGIQEGVVRFEYPEQSAIPAISWLMKNDPDAARSVLKEIGFDTMQKIRLYPYPPDEADDRKTTTTGVQHVEAALSSGLRISRPSLHDMLVSPKTPHEVFVYLKEVLLHRACVRKDACKRRVDGIVARIIFIKKVLHRLAASSSSSSENGGNQEEDDDDDEVQMLVSFYSAEEEQALRRFLQRICAAKKSKKHQFRRMICSTIWAANQNIIISGENGGENGGAGAAGTMAFRISRRTYSILQKQILASQADGYLDRIEQHHERLLTLHSHLCHLHYCLSVVVDKFAQATMHACNNVNYSRVPTLPAEVLEEIRTVLRELYLPRKVSLPPSENHALERVAELLDQLVALPIKDIAFKSSELYAKKIQSFAVVLNTPDMPDSLSQAIVDEFYRSFYACPMPIQFQAGGTVRSVEFFPWITAMLIRDSSAPPPRHPSWITDLFLNMQGGNNAPSSSTAKEACYYYHYEEGENLHLHRDNSHLLHNNNNNNNNNNNTFMAAITAKEIYTFYFSEKNPAWAASPCPNKLGQSLEFLIKRAKLQNEVIHLPVLAKDIFCGLFSTRFLAAVRHAHKLVFSSCPRLKEALGIPEIVFEAAETQNAEFFSSVMRLEARKDEYLDALRHTRHELLPLIGESASSVDSRQASVIEMGWRRFLCEKSADDMGSGRRVDPIPDMCLQRILLLLQKVYTARDHSDGSGSGSGSGAAAAEDDDNDDVDVEKDLSVEKSARILSLSLMSLNWRNTWCWGNQATNQNCIDLAYAASLGHALPAAQLCDKDPAFWVRMAENIWARASAWSTSEAHKALGGNPCMYHSDVSNALTHLCVALFLARTDRGITSVLNEILIVTRTSSLNSFKEKSSCKLWALFFRHLPAFYQDIVQEFPLIILDPTTTTTDNDDDDAKKEDAAVLRHAA